MSENIIFHDLLHILCLCIIALFYGGTTFASSAAGYTIFFNICFLGQIFRYLVIFLRFTIFHRPEMNTKMMSNIIVLQYNIILDGDDSLKLSARKM